jgi:hypothetical protein
MSRTIEVRAMQNPNHTPSDLGVFVPWWFVVPSPPSDIILRRRTSAQVEVHQGDPERALIATPKKGDYVAKNALRDIIPPRQNSRGTYAGWRTWRSRQNRGSRQQSAKFARCSTSRREYLEHLGHLEESRRFDLRLRISPETPGSRRGLFPPDP